MDDYYKEGLAADRLKRAYELATPRVQQYLDKEIEYVLSFISKSDSVLEMGCGYGRVLLCLADALVCWQAMPDSLGHTRAYAAHKNKTGYACGIDSSLSSLMSAQKYLNKSNNVALCQMNADELGFMNDAFDIIVCIQNGISAFHVDPVKLVKEMIRVAKPGGKVLISSYSKKFWDDRLEWFRIQSEHGLLGEIDWDKTKDGKIICKDGFTASTYNEKDFRQLMSNFDNEYSIKEVDNSSLFCVIEVK